MIQNVKFSGGKFFLCPQGNLLICQILNFEYRILRNICYGFFSTPQIQLTLKQKKFFLFENKKSIIKITSKHETDHIKYFIFGNHRKSCQGH